MINSTTAKLSARDWERIMQLGVDSHIKELESELARVAEKIKGLEAKYRMTFARLEQVGLPDNAGVEEHEDYVEWSGWEGYQIELREKLSNLRALVQADVR